jgi:propionyl-CoA carboxylase beta chain
VINAVKQARQKRGLSQIQLAERIKEYQARFANPFIAAERGYIDEVILPRNTRRRICRALNMLRNKTVENPWKKHDNIPL